MAEENSSKDDARKERVLETVTAVLLGVTTLLTAWATWIGSLHGGHEQIHFTESNIIASGAIALYGDATQRVVQDVSVWGSIQNSLLDAQAAADQGDETARQAALAKIEALEQMCTPELKAAIDWSVESGKSPFEMEGYAESYYEEAKATAEESQSVLEAGKQDNMNSHRFGLVTVIYSLVLFLLGISNTFKRSRNRVAIMGTAIALLAVGVVLMATIPMPTNFNLFTYLGGTS